MIGYATTEELIQYAAARGVTLSQAPEVLLTLALDYIESMEPLIDGERADPEQPYSWPRTLTSGVPLAVKQSQMIAAMTADTGVVLMPVTSGAQIIREKVSPLETEYADGDGLVNRVTNADMFVLSPLVLPIGGEFNTLGFYLGAVFLNVLII